MLTNAQLQIDSIVSFDLYPSSILGPGYKNAKVLAILDASTAGAFIDPAAVHANVFPSLPPGTPSSYTGYSYVRLKLTSGQTTVIGIPWIKDSTFQVLSTKRMTIVIDNVSPADQNTIVAALSGINYPPSSVTLDDPVS